MIELIVTEGSNKTINYSKPRIHVLRSKVISILRLAHQKMRRQRATSSKKISAVDPATNGQRHAEASPLTHPRPRPPAGSSPGRPGRWLSPRHGEEGGAAPRCTSGFGSRPPPVHRGEGPAGPRLLAPADRTFLLAARGNATPGAHAAAVRRATHRDAAEENGGGAAATSS